MCVVMTGVEQGGVLGPVLFRVLIILSMQAKNDVV